VRIAGNPRGLGSTLRATLRLLSMGQALYHSPDWIAVPAVLGVWRTVVTVHDLIPLTTPEWVPHSFKARHPRLYRAVIRSIARGAEAVLTDTPHWAAEILEHLGVAPGRLHVIPLGVSRGCPSPPAQLDATRRRFRLGDDPYVLTVGRPEPYKGLDRVIRAFARARRGERLVIVGMCDPRYPKDREEVRRLRLEDRVVFAGTVDPETLESLYRGASAFFTMSRFEGFGLCPLEALARDVPVLAARTCVTDHTVGPAAFLVDPDDERGAAAALRRLLDDEALRASLIRAGRERVARFSWEACARATADVYRRALRARRPARVAGDPVMEPAAAAGLVRARAVPDRAAPV
jgi:alpha-1,3-rhamnosyl/mannosyltransferase